MKKTLKIILPVYNEEKSIIPLKKDLLKLEKAISNKYKVIYVWINDGSTDNSSKKLKGLENKKNIILSFITNYGKTSAIQAGIDVFSSDYVAILDTDLQDNPKYIKEMLSKIEKNKSDFIIGNRFNRYGNNSLKKISSHFIRTIIKILFPKLQIHDINCGLKVITGQVSEHLYLKSDFHRYLPLIAHLYGFSVSEYKIKQRNRKYGTSKYGMTGFKRTWKSISDLLSIIFIFKFAKNPFSFFGKIGLFSTFIGVGILLYLTIYWFQGNPINSRPLFFLGTLATTTGINLLSLGLIGDLIKLSEREKYYIVRK